MPTLPPAGPIDLTEKDGLSAAPSNGDAGGLLSLRKALRLLQEFSHEEPTLGVSELARRLGMSKSSVHRILSTLHDEGFVVRTGDGHYRLGLRLYDLGELVVNSLELREVAHPTLMWLRNESGETAHLAVLDHLEVVYLERIESASTLRLFIRIGRRAPAHATSTGKCLLAFSDQEVIEGVLSRQMNRLTPRTIASRSALLSALRRVRDDGYAVSVEESEIGVISVGAPVFGRQGTAIAAVSVAGPMIRMSEASLPRYTRLVVQAAQEISRHMGHRANGRRL